MILLIATYKEPENMDKEIDAIGNLLLQLPDEKFYFLSALAAVVMIALAAIFKHQRNK